VRLHTGAQAAGAADRLGARAFTWGGRIVFGTNHYAPHTDSGLALLAHELAHVIQQGADAPRATTLPLPLDPDDALECEAVRAERLFASSESMPMISRGAPPAIRRVIIIKAPATTGVDIIKAGVVAEATTEVGTDQRSVSFNLRRNFNRIDPPRSGTAFQFLGHVGVSFAPGDPVTDFTFGWVQFMRQIDLRIVYAGREDVEGQVVSSPLSLIGTNFLIDRLPAGSAFSPFAQNPILGRFDAGIGQFLMPQEDHPMITVRDRVHNFTTGHPNFLFSLLDHREAVSIFVVRDKFGAFTQLAHVSWDLFYQGTFKWRDGHILTVSDNWDFTPKPAVKGPPTDRRITALMAKLSPSIAPMFNPTGEGALRAAAVPPPPDNPNRIETDHYTDRIPALFSLEGPGSLNIP
jgi:hypothetical protein